MTADQHAVHVDLADAQHILQCDAVCVYVHVRSCKGCGENVHARTRRTINSGKITRAAPQKAPANTKTSIFPARATGPRGQDAQP